MAGYVHLVILIIFNVLFVNVIGEGDSRYVAFVIDDTYSMANDIDGVKSQTHQVFDAILKSDVTKFDKFALLTFNDPSPGEVRIITDDPNAFKSSLDSINVSGGGDCPELAMHGILNALNTCPSYSVIYVFTDAAAKDYFKFEEIKSLSLKKSIQVTFLLTGLCGDIKGSTNENYLVYHKIAEATSGQVFHLSKSNISTAIGYITQSIASERHLIGQKTSQCPLDVNFKLDDKSGNVLISASKFLENVPKTDDKMSLKVFDAENNEVESYSMIDLKYMNVLHIRNPKPGYYKARLDCHDRLRTRLTITGSTSISFMHGFSKDKPGSMKETTALPVPGEESFLSIILDNPTKDVRLNRVELIDVDSNVIGKPIALKLVNAKQQLYTTTSKIALPDKMFKIKVNGYTKSREGITRVGATFIEPQKVFGEIENKSPTVNIIGDTEISTESNTPVTLKCDVQAYPKPEIIWVSDDGEESHPEIITVDVMGQFKSILQVGESNKNTTYYCRAKNSMGGDEAHAKITRIEEPPRIKYAGDEIQRLEETMVEIPCSIIKGNPTPHVEWLKNSNVINGGSKYQILGDYTLRFQADPSDNDAIFTCEAKNHKGSSKRNVHVTVYAKPEIKDAEKGNIINVALNKAIDLQCIAKGNPLPEIQWLNTTNKIITFEYRSRDYARSKATISDSGNYTCVATNAWGIDKKTFQVKVHVPVRTIMPPSTTITVQVASRLNLPCAASGYPEPTAKIIYFSKDHKSQIVLKEGKSGEKVTEEIYLATQENSGYYVCIASNEYTSSNFTYIVNVEAPPSITDSWFTYISAVEGDLLVRIPCRFRGNPKPILTWKFREHPLTDAVAHKILDDGTLVLLKPYTNLSGDYRCEARSTTRIATKTVTVDIRAYPEGPGEKEVPKTLIVEETPSVIPCTIPHSGEDLVRWFKDKKEIQIGELNIDKPSMRDNGLYTCRVSNTATSISYHTTVVVGFKPRFINADPTGPIEYIRGSDTLLDCSAQAVPHPEIKWTLNDKKHSVISMDYKITNMTAEDIGVYKCTVFNSFGEITRKYRIKSGECQLNISHDSIAFQPLILTDTEKWPELEIKNGSMIVPHEKPLMLFCPESSFNYPGLETVQKVKAVCISDSTFAIRDKEIKFSDLKCQTEVKVYAVPEKIGNELGHCLPGRKKQYSQLYMIGYKYEGKIKILYHICFDHEDNVPVFSMYSIVASVSNEGLKEELPFINSGVDLPHDFSQLYDPSRQIRKLSNLLGREFENNSCHFRKKQLVVSQDILPGLSQTATFHYLNIMPHWSLCYQQNWEEVENKVRKFASSLTFSVHIWTGTYGRMRLPSQKIDSDVHLSDDSGNKQYVPLYLWKVIQTYTDGMVAIIQINLPNLSDTEATKYVKCPDICHEVSWLRSEEWHNVKRGYIFCCNINEFEDKFHFQRMFRGHRNVLGTSPW